MALFDEPSRKPLPTTAELEDHRVSVIKGAISAIPVLGGVLAEELGLVLAPPLTRRRDEWFEDLARRLHDLEDRVEGFRFEDLASNEQFVSAAVQVTQAALRTRDREKLEALRNAVLNIACGKGPDDDSQAIFLSVVDTLTPAHLRMLKFFNEGKGTIPRVLIPEAIEAAKLHVLGLKSLGDQALRLLFQDLHRAGFVNVTEDQQRIVAPNGRWTTDWGHKLLTFITEPKETVLS